MADSASRMSFDFSLSEHVERDDARVIEVAGEVDIFTAPELKRTITAAIDDGARVIVVDLTETRFLDSTALGVLIGAVKRLRPVDGRMVIVNTEPSTAKTFEITGLDQIFDVVSEREQALRSARSR